LGSTGHRIFVGWVGTHPARLQSPGAPRPAHAAVRGAFRALCSGMFGGESTPRRAEGI